jgi:exosome complex component RRP42
MVSNLTKSRIIEYLNAGKRFDSRGVFDFRDLKIETGISNHAEGSARVKLGKTEILAGIKIGTAEPYTDSEDAGVLTTTAELSPLSSSKFEYGPPGIESIELARIVDRGIRESGMIDFKKLCIKEGEKVYSIYLDIYPINHDGNLIDAAAIASVAALLTSKMPKVDDEGNVQFGEWTNKGIPLTKNIPTTLTFYKIGKHILLDPVIEEEESSDARVSIAISHDKKPMIHAMQKGGYESFTKDEMFKIIDEAAKKSKEIFNQINKQVKVENE